MRAHRDLLGVISAAIVLAGCATGAATKSPAPSSAPASSAASTPFNCLTATGSDIPVSSSRPCTATGRSYSNQDLRQTGETYNAQALSKLDPAITVVH